MGSYVYILYRLKHAKLCIVIKHQKGEIERAFPAYLILVFVNNTLSINVVINLCRILWYSCTRYWVSYIIIHDNY
jgi:hypothetical protein